MKEGTCSLCKKDTTNLWLINLAEIDSLKFYDGKNVSKDVCSDCAAMIHKTVNSLENGNKEKKDNTMLKENDKSTSLAYGSGNGQAKVQDSYLQKLVKDKRSVHIEAIEGIGWRGILKSYDEVSIIISDEKEKKEELVFKRAIKSIKPLSK